MTENSDKRGIIELAGKVAGLENDLAAMTIDRDEWKTLYMRAMETITDHTKGLQSWRDSLNVSGTSERGGINFPVKEER